MKYSGVVIKGFGRGKAIGFPTINLAIPQDFRADFGIHAAWVWVGDQKYKGAVHYGPVLTFGLADPSLEVYLLDYKNEETIKELNFELVKYLRPIIKFDRIKDLKNGIKGDIEDVRRVLRN